MNTFNPMAHPLTESALRAGVPEIEIRAASNADELRDAVLGSFRARAIAQFERNRRRAISRQRRAEHQERTGGA